jgi:hypothetical protein
MTNAFPEAVDTDLPDEEILEHELKFTVPIQCASSVLDWMRRVCVPDPAYPRGIVSSIYYDTPAGAYLFEKLNSDYLKTKIRLRWYGNPEDPSRDGFAFLEGKYRIGNCRDKAHLEMPFKGSWVAGLSLDDPQLRTIPQRLRQAGYPADPAIVPWLLIRYERFRFIDPASGVRVSLDRDISAPAWNRLVMRPAAPAHLPIAVAEIKGRTDGLPPALYGLIARGGRKAAFSKVTSCYLQMMRVAV